MSEFGVAILGGYGLFGSRIARRIAREPGWRIVVAGRDGSAARRLVETLKCAPSAQASLACLTCEVQEADLSARIADSGANLVINASGPFQGRDYRVARAALAAGAHYVDLADARAYVAGFHALDDEARARGLLAVAGASTVPALSAAVVDHHRAEFAALDAIRTGISPGNRTPRGLATVAAILSYVGKPLPWRGGGAVRNVHGWQALVRHRYGAPVGPRWLAACDVPDLDLFPQRYPDLRTLEFRAGLEKRRLHFGLGLLSWCVRFGLVRNLDRHAPLLKSLSERGAGGGSDAGAMHVAMSGADAAGAPRSILWELIARDGDGPEVPATPAVVLARKLAAGALNVRGAMPCLGLFTLDEAIAALDGFAVTTYVARDQSRNRAV